MFSRELAMPASAVRNAVAEGDRVETVTIRLSERDAAALDAWIEDQSRPKPSRAEAIRRLMNQALGGFDEHARDAIRVSELNSQNDV
jgi:hypothetical protein